MKDDFKTIASEERKDVGRHLNELKTRVQEKFNHFKDKLEQGEEVSSSDGHL